MNSNDSKKEDRRIHPRLSHLSRTPQASPTAPRRTKSTRWRARAKPRNRAKAPTHHRQTSRPPVPGQKPDEHKGAVEGDHRSDKEQGNKNAEGALDKNGLPKNKKPSRKIPSARVRTTHGDGVASAEQVSGGDTRRYSLVLFVQRIGGLDPLRIVVSIACRPTEHDDITCAFTGGAHHETTDGACPVRRNSMCAR